MHNMTDKEFEDLYGVWESEDQEIEEWRKEKTEKLAHDFALIAIGFLVISAIILFA